MQPVRVPKPSPGAFHKNRRISDLLLWQITHFQHVAQKRSLKLDPEVARDVHTEGGAARFIATVTRALRNEAPSKSMTVVPTGRDRSTVDAKAAKASAGVVRNIAATTKSRRHQPKKHATEEPATSASPKKAVGNADGDVRKKSKSGTKDTNKRKPQAGSKLGTKTNPRKKS